MSVEKIYWDSDCFLGFFKNEPNKAEKCDGVIKRAERGEVLIITSALTLAEVLWMRNDSKISQEDADIIQKFFRRSFIRVNNVTRKIAENAQLYVWNNNIKPKDAIHVSTAIHLKVDALETFDKKLISKSGTVGSPLLLIREPKEERQSSLNV